MPDGSRFDQAFRFANIAALEVRRDFCRCKKNMPGTRPGMGIHVKFGSGAI
jgi:hypothetical protein